MSMSMSEKLFPLTFDFGLGALDGDADPSAPDACSRGKGVPKGDKEKRLARCGKCDNCCRQDCGTCYNCADKPKFGGPGVKKQACINRKCLLMVPKEDEDKVARKRINKPRGGVAEEGSPKKVCRIDTLVLSPRSPSDSPEHDWMSEQSSEDNMPPLDSPVDPPTEEEPVPEAKGLDAMVIDEDEGIPNLDADEWGANHSTEALLEYLETRKGRSEGLKQMKADEKAEANAQREWTWNNPALLHEEFISVNERHRRESQTNPIAVF